MESKNGSKESASSAQYKNGFATSPNLALKSSFSLVLTRFFHFLELGKFAIRATRVELTLIIDDRY